MLGKIIALIWAARKQMRLTFLLLFDRRISPWKKIIPLMPLFWMVSPLNLITLTIPFVGQVEDVVMIWLSMKLLERVVPEHILQEHQLKAER